MTVPRIENLRRENWAGLSPSEKLQALQDLENGLAAQENRNPVKVGFIPDKYYKTEEDHKNLYGLYVPKGVDENGVEQDERIYINEDLLTNSTTPYAAVETQFHESRHAYQTALTEDPNLATTPQELDDIGKNLHGGYLDNEKFGYDYYRWQPSEKDANETARAKTDELYMSEFQDMGYQDSDYYDNRGAVEAAEIKSATENIGEDYIEQARQLSDMKYDLVQGQQEGLSDEMSETPVTEVNYQPPLGQASPGVAEVESIGKSGSAETEGETAGNSPNAGPALEQAEAQAETPASAPVSETPSASIDEDYGYGYGM